MGTGRMGRRESGEGELRVGRENGEEGGRGGRMERREEEEGEWRGGRKRRESGEEGGGGGREMGLGRMGRGEDYFMYKEGCLMFYSLLQTGSWLPCAMVKSTAQPVGTCLLGKAHTVVWE